MRLHHVSRCQAVAGLPIATDVKQVVYPERYMDERGAKMCNGTVATSRPQPESSGMKADTTPNAQAAAIEAELRVDTPTMERLRRAQRERARGLFLKGPVPLDRIAAR